MKLNRFKVKPSNPNYYHPPKKLNRFKVKPSNPNYHHPGDRPGGGYGGAEPPQSPAGNIGGTGQLPWDAQYETQSGLLNRNYQNQVAQFGQQEEQTRSSFGFDPQYANNPLTRANLLQKSYQQGRLGATNSMAARGQLYSGATSNALGYQDFNYAQNQNNLQTDYQSLLNKIAQGRVGARQALDEGLAAAEADRLDRALSQDPEAEPQDVGDEGGGGGGGGKRKGARQGVKQGARQGKLNRFKVKPSNPNYYHPPAKRKR